MDPTTTDDQFPRLDRGAGPAVVLLHGVFGRPENWGHTVAALAHDRRMVALELPVFDLALPDCTVAGFADYVRRFLDWAGVDRAVVGGNSLGGHVALDLAVRAADRVSGLVLTGSSGLFERSFERGVPTNPSREWLWTRMREVFYREESIESGTLDVVESVLTHRANRLRLLRVARSAKGTHMGPMLERVTAPTLLVWGREDRVTPLETAYEFLDGIPTAELVLIDRCGHVPMIECPAEFTRALEGFLRGLPELAASPAGR